MRVVIARTRRCSGRAHRLLEDAATPCARPSPTGRAAAAVAEHKPDVAVVDIRMPPTHTDEGCGRRCGCGRTSRHRVLVLSSTSRRVRGQLLEGNAAGVGYLLKDRVADVATSCRADRVADGGTALDPEVVSQLFRASRHATGWPG